MVDGESPVIPSDAAIRTAGKAMPLVDVTAPHVVRDE
jgi:hypothetical protein